LSIGASSDLHNATEIARALVGAAATGVEVGIGRWAHDDAPVSAARARIDQEVRTILEAERARAKEILETQRALLVALRDLLLERKVLDRASFAHLTPDKPDTSAAHG
jgi:cell division protease FtsH